ncbi:MAG: hypothetical protein HRF45_11710 [Fimbriimonadia bacterium]
MTANGMRTDRGQTLIIALFVVFVMLFLGLVFVGIIGRNLFYAQRNTQSISAENFAESGIRYAHMMLRTSPEGADWRPVPANLPPTQQDDPDYLWLRAPDPNIPNDFGGPPRGPGDPGGDGSFTRLNFDQGRALIRLTYAPKVDDPLSRYIKIESVGRIGEMRPNDPTMKRGVTARTFRLKVAYAMIGITDYARFITNLDRKPQPADLGIPVNFGAMFGAGQVSVPMFLGDPVAYSQFVGGLQTRSYGGPLRVNSGLRIWGDLRIYLNPDFGDKVEVAGDIEFATASSSGRLLRHDMLGLILMQRSASPVFNTYQGMVRDGRRQSDTQNYPRGIEYLDPPIINEVDGVGRERYLAATRHTGLWIRGADGRYFNTGDLGYGEGVYIDNSSDRQDDVTSFAGGRSLRNEWLKPNVDSPYWQGPYYVPPGCYIQLIPATPQVPGGFRIIRNIRDDGQRWRTPLNEPTPRHSLRFFIEKDPNSPTGAIIWNELGGRDAATTFNGVIYAEGNVRVRGIIPGGHQLTIVSGGTIYIEGSIIKGRLANEGVGEESCALALLAKDYVCLNTTQFVGPAFDTPLNFEPDALDVIAPYHVTVEQNRPFNAIWEFGDDPNQYTGSGRYPRLYVRHAAQSGGAAFINLLVNYGLNPAGSEYLFDNAPPNYAGVFYGTQQKIPTYGLADAATQVFPRYEHRSFGLAPPADYGGYPLLTSGELNTMTFQSDARIASRGGNRPYFLSRLAIQPMDVRIEALIYAQSGSFFVIPGPWFNANPNDRRELYSNELARLNAFGVYADFPFYAEPLDIKVTIRGAVSENFPPPIADQTEWLQRWGWIPKEYGESGVTIPDQHVPADFQNRSYVPNLYIVYDTTFASARPAGLFARDPMRVDRYGRMLPAVPRLPVSPRLLYFGEVRP